MNIMLLFFFESSIYAASFFKFATYMTCDILGNSFVKFSVFNLSSLKLKTQSIVKSVDNISSPSFCIFRSAKLEMAPLCALFALHVLVIAQAWLWMDTIFDGSCSKFLHSVPFSCCIKASSIVISMKLLMLIIICIIITTITI